MRAGRLPGIAGPVGAAVLLMVALVPSAAFAQVAEMRCGWFSNPTPGNASLTDKDGEWIIGAQGGYQAEGDWPPEGYGKGQWVGINASYGYGCACMKVSVDKKAGRVIRIFSAKARTLAACRKDAALKRGEARLQ